MTRSPTLPSSGGLTPLIRFARLTYYRWALREICPLHPDVPHIVRRIAHLEAL